MKLLNHEEKVGDPHVLDVRASVSGRSWRYRLDAKKAIQAEVIVERYGLNSSIAGILAGRNVDPDDVPSFTHPTLKELMPNPSCIRDVDFSASRLAEAVIRREFVVLLGDYDVDGATSVALIANWLRTLGIKYSVYIPDRILDGYGPNLMCIKEFAEAGATLFISVDCGSTSFDVFSETAKLGLDVIIIDHHQCSLELPQVTAIVNPNRHDDLSGCGYLCAVGLVFLVLVAANRELRRREIFTNVSEPYLLQWMDLVALGTVADVVPLIGLNRAYVVSGLRVANHKRSVGLSSLLEVSGVYGKIKASHLGYTFGPRINAGGRIGKASLGVDLLTTTDKHQADLLAVQLDKLNKTRQAIEAETLIDAEVQMEQQVGDHAVIVVSSRSWHPGVVGLVAARLKERWRRPAFAITFDHNGLGVGSGRSIPGIDLGKAVSLAMSNGVLIKGGGHAMAAGITLRDDRLGAFTDFMQNQLFDTVMRELSCDRLRIDGVLTAGAINLEFAKLLENAGPYGQGHPEPIFAIPAHKITSVQQFGSHLRFNLRHDSGASISCIAFKSVGTNLGESITQARGTKMHIAGSIAINCWGGKERVQMLVLDAAKP